MTHGDTPAKVLRYELQQAEVNGTEIQERRIAQRREALDRRLEGGLSKRDNNWNWKHLEDYRGFLYFIESMSNFPLSPCGPIPL